MAWKHFCSKVNFYNPHSRRTATRDIVETYEKRKGVLKNWMTSSKQRVSLTTDIWVAQITGASYMVVTAHFVGANWELKKIIIGFKYVTDHKCQTISNILLVCLAEWGIEKNFCVTLDNASANTSALKTFHREFGCVSSEALVLDGSYQHMRCCAHILNLVANQGLNELGDSVAAVRNTVQYVRSSTNRLKAFELRVDTGNIARGSSPLDVKTRWNSTFLMLSRASKYNGAFDRMEAEDKVYNEYFLELENGKKRFGPPQSADWDAIEKLVRFLVMFYNSTLTVSESTTVNSYKCYGVIVTIESNLNDMSNGIDLDLRKKASDMLIKFQKYWDGFKKLNKMIIVAAIFDPRKKMGYCKLCFETLYGKESVEAKEIYQSVFCLITSLYAEYNGRYNPRNSGKGSITQSGSGSQSKHADKMDFVLEGFKYNNIDVVYKDLIDETGVADVKDELEIYLNESVENPNLLAGVVEYNVLGWWKVTSYKFPVLSEIAKDIFAMQVSSVASESAFSTSGRVLEPYRSCLTHYMIEALLCTEQWMKADIQISESSVLTNEQILADVELLDSLEKKFSNPSVV